MTIDIAQFRKQYLEFSDADAYTDDYITMCYETALCYIDVSHNFYTCDRCDTLILYLMTAHLCLTNSPLGEYGGSVGNVTSSRIGDIAVSISSVSSSKDAYAQWLAQTSYGEQLLALLSRFSSGGIYVGGSTLVQSLSSPSAPLNFTGAYPQYSPSNEESKTRDLATRALEMSRDAEQQVQGVNGAVQHAVDVTNALVEDGDEVLKSKYGGTLSQDYQPSPYRKRGVFGEGATLLSDREVVQDTTSGYWYMYTGAYPIKVPAQPDTLWLCVGYLDGYAINNIRNYVRNPDAADLTQMVDTLSHLGLWDLDLTGYSDIRLVKGVNIPDNPLSIRGAGIRNTRVYYSGEDAVFTFAGAINIRDMSLYSLSTQGVDYEGTGIHAPYKQAAFSSIVNVGVRGYLYGIMLRYSLWQKWDNVHFVDNACHIRFLRHDAPDDTDPPSINPWNDWHQGWFHNALNLSQVCLERGEVGIWGATMGCKIIAPTFQGMGYLRGSTANTVLPEGVEPCAAYFQGGYSTPATTSADAWNLEIDAAYIERCNAGIIVEGYKTAHISMFMQGGASVPAPGQQPRSKYAIKALSGSNVTVTYLTGQDWFDNVFIAKNNSSIRVMEWSGSIGGNYTQADATSSIVMQYPDQLFNLTSASSLASNTYTLVPRLQPGVYTVLVCGHMDGANYKYAEYKVCYYNSDNVIVNKTGTDQSDWYKVAVLSGQLVLNVTYGGRPKLVIKVTCDLLQTLSGGTASIGRSLHE